MVVIVSSCQINNDIIVLWYYYGFGHFSGAASLVYWASVEKSLISTL